MFAVERHQAIVKLINTNGKVTISELTSLFNVSSETIRKDLLILEKSKLLIRTHGGAISNANNNTLKPLIERLHTNTPEKAQLCSIAVKYINDGDTIAIDSGSTSVELAKLIVDKFSKLTVITHCLDVFNILMPNDGIDVVLCGGEYKRNEKAFCGNLTVDTINQIHTEKFFLFPSGISLKFGIMDYDGDILRNQKAYMNNTDKIFVLADSDKFEKAAYLKICEINRDYTYITDSGLPDEIFKEYKQNNIDIVRNAK